MSNTSKKLLLALLKIIVFMLMNDPAFGAIDREDIVKAYKDFEDSL